eukprot:COSAG03_NODE_80_length_14027_cov_69.115953_2_plen_732_part_00
MEADAQWLEELDQADLPLVESSVYRPEVGGRDDVDGIVCELLGLPPMDPALGQAMPSGPRIETPDNSCDSGSDGGSDGSVGGTIGRIGSDGSASSGCTVCPLCNEESSRTSRFWRKLGYAGPAYCWKCAQIFKSHMLKRSVASDICCREAPCPRCVQIFAYFTTTKSEVFTAADRASGSALVPPREVPTEDGQHTCPLCCTSGHAELRNYWGSVGYLGPSYCSSCSNRFRNHLIRRRGQSRTGCSREMPCDSCERILGHFRDRPGAFARMDLLNQRSAQRTRLSQATSTVCLSGRETETPRQIETDTVGEPSVAATSMPGGESWVDVESNVENPARQESTWQWRQRKRLRVSTPAPKQVVVGIGMLVGIIATVLLHSGPSLFPENNGGTEKSQHTSPAVMQPSIPPRTCASQTLPHQLGSCDRIPVGSTCSFRCVAGFIAHGRRTCQLYDSTVIDEANVVARAELRGWIYQGGRCVPSDPEPEPAAPEPKPAAPEPEPAAPEPEPAAPEPKPAAPEPESAAPVPTPEPTPKSWSCAISPCQNGGICQTVDSSSYLCTCQDGFVGMNCQTSPPAPSPVCPPGTAGDDVTCVECPPGKYSDVFGSATCSICPATTYSTYAGSTSCTDCAQGMTSVAGSTFCARDDKTENWSCASNPCQNGMCEAAGSSSYSCTCEAGWIGVNCEIEGDNSATEIWSCASSPCQNGMCEAAGSSGYSCKCEAGWIGVNCELRGH